jgi:hypothetical protein
MTRREQLAERVRVFANAVVDAETELRRLRKALAAAEDELALVEDDE